MIWTSIATLERAFRDEEHFHSEALGEVSVRCVTAGSLVVPSGQLVACDPLVFPETPPFQVRISPGNYPVLLSVVSIPWKKKQADERIAAAMLKLRRSKPVRWEMAVLTGDDPASFQQGEFYGYAVDSGTGCFMDLDAAARLQDNMKRDPEYFEQIIEATRKEYVPTRSWTDFPLGGAGRLNVITFSTGFGDGTYPSYWGYDRRGNRACLVTDLDVLERDEQFRTVS